MDRRGLFSGVERDATGGLERVGGLVAGWEADDEERGAWDDKEDRGWEDEECGGWEEGARWEEGGWEEGA